MKHIDEGVMLCGRYATGYKDKKTVPATHLWRSDVKTSPPEKGALLQMEGVTVSLITPWASNYFHWLLEELTMLLCLDPDEYDNILIAPWFHKRCYESIEYLGLASKVHYWTEHPMMVDLLSFGPQRVDGFSYMPGLNKLIDAFRQEPTGPEKIFVTRDNARERRILNMNEVVKKFPDYVFLTPDETIPDQAAYFGNVKHLIGPHGAALTNMIWAKRTKVTDLQGEYKNPCFANLAGQLGHEYEAVPCEPVGKDMRYTIL